MQTIEWHKIVREWGEIIHDNEDELEELEETWTEQFNWLDET